MRIATRPRSNTSTARSMRGEGKTGSTYSSRPRRSSETEVIPTAEITFARHRRPSLRWIRSTASHWEAPREVQRRRTPTHDQQAPWGKSRGLQEEENKKAMNCSRNYGGSNAIGIGEVDSSILSGSTIHSLAKNLKIQHNSRFRSIVSFDHFSHFEQNRPRRRVPTDTKLAHRFYFCLRPFRPGLRALSRPRPAPTRRPSQATARLLGPALTDCQARAKAISNLTTATRLAAPLCKLLAKGLPRAALCCRSLAGPLFMK
jgi:hypothetical protein